MGTLLPCGAGLEGKGWNAAAAGPSPRLSSDFMNVYYQIRSSQLDRSIKGLKEHFRKNSSASGVPYSPAIPNKRKDTPTKKPIKRPGESPPRPLEHQPGGGGPALVPPPPPPGSLRRALQLQAGRTESKRLPPARSHRGGSSCC